MFARCLRRSSAADGLHFAIVSGERGGVNPPFLRRAPTQRDRMRRGPDTIECGKSLAMTLEINRGLTPPARHGAALVRRASRGPSRITSVPGFRDVSTCAQRGRLAALRRRLSRKRQLPKISLRCARRLRRVESRGSREDSTAPAGQARTLPKGCHSGEAE